MVWCIGRNMTKHVIAIVGMPGAGKSEVATVFDREGFACVHFGEVTLEEMVRRGLPVTEANERQVREALRAEHGMAAYALLNVPKIDAALQGSSVVADGVYSWEEYALLKERYGQQMVTVAVVASPGTRELRLGLRPVRPLSSEELASRDRSEIENINKGGPIAMADITLVNEGSVEDLERQVLIVAEGLK